MDYLHVSTGIAVSLFLALVGLMLGFGKMLLSQFEKRLNERANATEQLRLSERTADQARMETLETNTTREAGRIGELLNRVEKLNVALPLEYVRREDWIRFSSTIDAKLDKLAEMIHNRLPGGNP